MNQITPEELEQLKQIEAMKKVVLGKVLSKDARERLGRIRLIKPELAEQLELYLLQLQQAGEIKVMINDSQLREILNSITSKKRFNIRR